MAKSGMRYKKTLVLVELIKQKHTEMADILKTLSEDRTAEVANVYGGEAADNFKENVKKIADYIDGQIEDIIKKLTDEAETQHDAYMAQEQSLKSQITMDK